ncbi:MAG: hypothetical protein WD065_00640, partial [Planctomycetaceae bacterium]
RVKGPVQVSQHSDTGQAEAWECTAGARGDNALIAEPKCRGDAAVTARKWAGIAADIKADLDTAPGIEAVIEDNTVITAGVAVGTDIIASPTSA